MNYQLKALVILISAFYLYSCNSSQEEELEVEFSMQVIPVGTKISALFINDQTVEVDFIIDPLQQDFEYLEIYWEYDNEADIQSEDQLVYQSEFHTIIEKSSFNISQEELSYRYSIEENELYSLFPSLIDFDFVEPGLEFKLLWQAYDSNGRIVSSNAGRRIAVSVDCSPNEDFMVGDYVLSSVVTNELLIFGDPHVFKQDTISINIGEEAMIRELNVSFYEIDIKLRASLNCDGLSIEKELNSDQLNCGDDEFVFFSESPTYLNYSDDSELIFYFTVDYGNNCGLTGEETFTLVKVY